MALGEKKSVVMEEQMGVPGGVATLDEGGKLTQSQIPSMDFAEAGTKNTLDDGDAVAITDSTEDNATKRVLWSTVKSLLGNLFVPLTRTVNGKALSSDITLSADNVGARANTWTPTADQVGAVPTNRKVNNKALSADVTLDAGDVGAAPLNFTRSHLFGTSSESSSDWIEIGRCKLSGTYQSRRFLFSVCGLNGRGSGILSLSLRVDGTAGKLSAANSYLRWLTLDLAEMKDIFAVEMDEEYAVLYLKIFGSYQCYHIGMLDYGVNSTEFVSPTDPDVFQFETNWMLQGNHKASITAALTSTSIFTPDIFGAAASGWVNGRLLVGGSTGGVTQLGHPSSAGSVLRSGTSGGPYWTSIADLIAAMGAVRIKCGTYTGNGEYDSESSYTSVPQTINLGLKPKAVLVMSETGGMDSGSGRYYGGLVWDGSDLVVFLDTNYGDINANVITLTNSGFTVYVQRVQMSSSSYRYIATNEDGRKYRYIVFY